MKIAFNELKLSAFKNHRELMLSFGEFTRITGKNGAGKSSIGEAITWLLYGVDPLGNQMNKDLSPEPTTYQFEQVEVQLLLTVDDKQLLLGRTLPAGKTTKYYVNEVPKKAGEFDEIVNQLFDKQLFLSLFTPSYFFTQRWEEQRAQLLKYVLPPSNKEVFAHLPAPQADKLAELVKKKSLNDLEAQHKENRRKKDKELIAAKSRTKTLEDQIQSLPDVEIDIEGLTKRMTEIDSILSSLKEKQTEASVHNSRIEKLKTQLQVTKEGADKVRAEFEHIKAKPIDQECYACGQQLTDEATAALHSNKNEALEELKGKYRMLSDQFDRMRNELKDLNFMDTPDVRGLSEERHNIGNLLQEFTSRQTLISMIEDAQANETLIHDSYTESVFILDAIKAFRAAEAEMMAKKLRGMFDRLTLKLFIENKGDGEQKPHFEVEMDGKPYRKLSTAEKILAGLELISVLSQQSGVAAPVFVDNAESIISYKQPNSQLIECQVADKPLTIEEVL